MSAASPAHVHHMLDTCFVQVCTFQLNKGVDSASMANTNTSGSLLKTHPDLDFALLQAVWPYPTSSACCPGNV